MRVEPRWLGPESSQHQERLIRAHLAFSARGAAIGQEKPSWAMVHSFSATSCVSHRHLTSTIGSITSHRRLFFYSPRPLKLARVLPSASRCLRRFCHSVAAPHLASFTPPLKSTSASKRLPIPPKAPPSFRLFVDTTALSVPTAPHQSPRSVKPPHPGCGRVSVLSPARIVVSLQYSLSFSRHILRPTHYAAKISVPPPTTCPTPTLPPHRVTEKLLQT